MSKKKKHFWSRDRSERKKKMDQEAPVMEEQKTEVVEEIPQEPAEEPEAVPSELEKLQEELGKVTAERDEYLDLAQRQKAEFANYRRRTEGIRHEAYEDGERDVIAKFLDVVDNLERALSADENESPLRSGVELVLRQTQDTLTKLGVKEIEALGLPFDAEKMNAVLQGTEDEGEPGTVCQVLQKGYELGSRVIRHAMVKVVAG